MFRRGAMALYALVVAVLAGLGGTAGALAGQAPAGSQPPEPVTASWPAASWVLGRAAAVPAAAGSGAQDPDGDDLTTGPRTALSPGHEAFLPSAAELGMAPSWPQPPPPAEPGMTAPRTAGPRVVRQSRLAWPLSPVPVVTKYFDAPETPYGAGHRGVDLAAVPGQEVLAADAGVVVFAGLVGGRPVLSVDHDGGLRTTYEPVEPKVAAGDQVYRGQVLGTVVAGHPGCAVAACLHWGVRRGEEYVDPLALTGEVGEFRLKPWGGGP